MTPKDFVVLVLYIVGIILFTFVTFRIVTTSEYDLVAGGLLAWLIGITVDRFINA